jgi:hypothetical protein
VVVPGRVDCCGDVLHLEGVVKMVPEKIGRIVQIHVIHEPIMNEARDIVLGAQLNLYMLDEVGCVWLYRDSDMDSAVDGTHCLINPAEE